MLRFAKVCKENIEQSINIRVNREQKKIIVPVMVLLAQSHIYDTLRPFLVLDDDKTVGFILFEVDKSDDTYEICRIMIDKKEQGKEYCRKTMELAIDYLKNEGAKVITLSHRVDSPHPSHLYLSLGFKYTGVIEGDIERLMELKL